MTVLGIDTATAAASVGVSRSGSVVAERTEVHERDHAAALPAMVEGVLAEAGLALGDVDGIAISIGPGSFTGLRVGLSFAKGVAYASAKPLAWVSTLEAFAVAADVGADLVATCLDARKGEVYVAAYRRTGGDVEEILPPRALAPAAAAAEIASAFGGRRGAVVGDAAGRYVAEFTPLAQRGITLPPLSRVHPRGGVVAALGRRALGRSGGSRIGELEPFYLRPSEAERRRTG